MQDDMTTTRRWRVSGRVQGVGFRLAARRAAASLGIVDGWAHNLDDGDVEVCAVGSDAALDRLHEWLRQGPALARVGRVEELAPPSRRPVGFAIGRT